MFRYTVRRRIRMYAVGKLISQGVYTVAGPFHPFGGAVDIIVVQQQDGSFKSSPWYVKFGKFQGVLKRSEKVVDIAVNDEKLNFHMYLDSTGEAYFLKDVEPDKEPAKPLAITSGEEVSELNADLNKLENGLETKVVEEDTDKGESSDEKDSNLALRFEGRKASYLLVQQARAAEDAKIAAGLPESSTSEEDRAGKQVCKGEPSNELLSSLAALKLKSTSVAELENATGGSAIHALLNQAAGLDDSQKSGRPSSSLIAQAALAAVAKTANEPGAPQLVEIYETQSEVVPASNEVAESATGPGALQVDEDHRSQSEVTPASIQGLKSVGHAEDGELSAGDSSSTSLANGTALSDSISSTTGVSEEDELQRSQPEVIVVSTEVATAVIRVDAPELVKSLRPMSETTPVSSVQGLDSVGAGENGEQLGVTELSLDRENSSADMDSMDATIRVLQVNETQRDQSEVPTSLEDTEAALEVGASQLDEMHRTESEVTPESTQVAEAASEVGAPKADELLRTQSDVTPASIEVVMAGIEPDAPQVDAISRSQSEVTPASAEELGAVGSTESRKPSDEDLSVEVVNESSDPMQVARPSREVIVEGFHSGKSRSVIIRSGPLADRLGLLKRTKSDSDLGRLKRAKGEPDLKIHQTVDTSPEVSTLTIKRADGVVILHTPRRSSPPPLPLREDQIQTLQQAPIIFEGGDLLLAFDGVVTQDIQGEISVEKVDPSPENKEVGGLVTAGSGGWKLWPSLLRRPKTPEKNGSAPTAPLVSGKALVVATRAGVNSALVTNLVSDSDYYLRSRKNKVRSFLPTSQMLASMNLKEGSNRITFTFFTRVLGRQQVDARIYLWKCDTRVVISDVDGTITKSDVLGQVMPLVGRDWTQSGVTRLFSAIKENGYEVMFLSARAISQAYLTRQFLLNLKQDGEALPDGPVVISPDGLFPSLYREVIRRAPHEFKIACLQDIRDLFPKDCNPFYAGFGNRDTDEISYLKVGIPKGKIFIINPKGEVAINNRVDVKSYTSLHKLVDDMFPPQTYTEQEDFNSWNYWKMPLPDIEDELSVKSNSKSKKTKS